MWFMSMLLGFFIPPWFWAAVIVIGVGMIIASQLVGWLPIVAPYKLPLLIVGLILAIGGVYNKGSADNEEKWRKKEKEVMEKTVEYAKASTKVNEKVKYVYITRNKKAEEIKASVNTYIAEHKEEINKQCTLSEYAINAHNLSAKGAEKETPKEVAK